jgi:RNA polymerase sigma-70 factor (ECF subfamily)
VKKIAVQARLVDMIEDYQKLVFSMCYRISGDFFAAEDLTQETFLSAYQKLESFDGSNEKAWLCRIATNKSIDYLRNAGRRQIPTEADFFWSQEEQRGTPEQVIIEDEIRQKIADCCDRLKPPYDEIARAFYLEDRSPTEIANTGNRKLKTVQTQIYRARDMLRKIYNEEAI